MACKLGPTPQTAPPDILPVALGHFVPAKNIPADQYLAIGILEIELCHGTGRVENRINTLT